MTRATLLTSPYRNGAGELVAWALIPGEKHRRLIDCREEHLDLKEGDTITVKRVGNEWRAG